MREVQFVCACLCRHVGLIVFYYCSSSHPSTRAARPRRLVVRVMAAAATVDDAAATVGEAPLAATGDEAATAATGDQAQEPPWDFDGAPSIDLHTAASLGIVSCMREILDARSGDGDLAVEVNAQNRGGWTPLAYAACAGSRECVQLLLEHGADPNLRTRLGRTPAIIAATYGHSQCIAMLHQHGADLEMRDSKDRTALFHAAALGQDRVVQTLVDLGANINCVEHFNGHSPMSIAMENHHDGIVEILLNAGSRFSLSGMNGSSLHPPMPNISATSPCGRARRSPEVESLVRRCANLTVKDSCTNLPPKSAIGSLADFLDHLGLSKYLPVLESQGIDLEQFLTFGDAQLEEAGIRLIGPKRKMAVAISKWNERERLETESLTLPRPLL